MKKIFYIIIIVLVLVFTCLFLQNQNSASLTLISPNGGEVLEAGSTYTIKWSSKNIPTDNKISISIRREATATEGQEFDPLIFFDLDNTGSVEWTVSNMYPEGDYLLSIASYSFMPVADPLIDESDAPFQIVKLSQTYFNEDFEYSLNYPHSLILREFEEISDGAGFHLKDETFTECITVSAREKAKSLENLSFDEYVKKAGIEEIQDFLRLNSIEKVTTISGLIGYKTTWAYAFLGGEEKISLPITYFEDPHNIQRTIQLNLNDSSCEDIYNEMLLHF
ncbi:MAG: Ser-Thr-rich GPI-anchored membrane family protein [Candidatus Paceibacterota bacterium]